MRQSIRREGKRKSAEAAPESGTRRLKRAKRLPTNGSTDNGPVEEDKTAELAAPYSNGAGGSRISHKLKKATGSAVGGRQKSPARDGSHGSARVTEVAEPSGVTESRVAARSGQWFGTGAVRYPWPWIWPGRPGLRLRARVTEVAEPSGVTESRVAARSGQWFGTGAVRYPWPWIWPGRPGLRLRGASICLRTACRVYFTKGEPRVVFFRWTAPPRPRSSRVSGLRTYTAWRLNKRLLIRPITHHNPMRVYTGALRGKAFQYGFFLRQAGIDLVNILKGDSRNEATEGGEITLPLRLLRVARGADPLSGLVQLLALPSSSSNSLLDSLRGLVAGSSQPVQRTDPAEATLSPANPQGKPSTTTPGSGENSQREYFSDRPGPSASLTGLTRAESHREDFSSEEEPLTGTFIPREAFEKAVDVIRRQLGFELPAMVEDPKARKLTLNTKRPDLRPTMPVDAERWDRYQAILDLKKYFPFPNKITSDFRVEERDWRDLFTSPSIPAAVSGKLHVAGVSDASGNFKDKTARSLSTEKHNTDEVRRAGMKFTSALLIIAELLTRSFQQTDESFSGKDTGALVTLLGAICRLCFDQFARGAAKAVTDSRNVILDSLSWPSTDVKKRFQRLPYTGGDLFGGKFDSLLQEEVRRYQAVRDADFSLPTQRPSANRV